MRSIAADDELLPLELLTDTLAHVLCPRRRSTASASRRRC